LTTGFRAAMHAKLRAGVIVTTFDLRVSLREMACRGTLSDRRRTGTRRSAQLLVGITLTQFGCGARKLGLWPRLQTSGCPRGAEKLEVREVVP